MRHLIKTLGRSAFIARVGTNNRGVEYSKEMVKQMLDNPDFDIHISNVSFDVGLNPIEKRKALITARRQNFENVVSNKITK